EIRGKRILFIEPLTTDAYCYFPFGEVGNQGLTQYRVRLALSSLAPACADCSLEPHHLWMPLTDLDDSAMQKQRIGDAIPSEPAFWRDTVSLCDGHAAEEFGITLSGSVIFFLPSDSRRVEIPDIIGDIST